MKHHTENPSRLQRKIDFALSSGIQIGEVFEFHLANDVFFPVRIRPLRDFLADWDYALAGKHWNEEVFPTDLPAIRRDRTYLAVVHSDADGAFLVEL